MGSLASARLIEIWNSGEVRICAYSRAILGGLGIANRLAAGCSGIDFLCLFEGDDYALEIGVPPRLLSFTPPHRKPRELKRKGLKSMTLGKWRENGNTRSIWSEKSGRVEGFQLFLLFRWWAVGDLNPGLPPCEDGTLPLS